MNIQNSSSILLLLLIILRATSFSSPGIAQVIVDKTLPENSRVKHTNKSFVIDGGTAIGGNLFHSFSQFSIPSGSVAIFNNNSSIENIISRVTGKIQSDIDGILRAGGNANFFLINPNGIVFGPNVQIDIGGSLFATTAESYKFKGGTEFSAVNPNVPPILTVSSPIGLQFKSNSGKIIVRGAGHNVVSGGGVIPSRASNNFQGLQLKSGQKLALIGGEVILDGGLLKTISGQIEIGSVDSGQIGLSLTPVGWFFNYTGATALRNIQLSQAALLDSSNGGSIHLHGNRVTFADSSLAFIQNNGSQSGGTIDINASESFELIGAAPNRNIPSALLYETLGNRDGGNITVSTQRLTLKDGGGILAITLGKGKASDIIINASESLQLLGSFGSSNQSLITTQTGTSGTSGDISVTTRNLTAFNGGAIGTQTRGTGKAGNVKITAVESIDVIGVVPEAAFGSTLGSSTQGVGNAGNTEITTSRLSIQEGGNIIVTSLSKGSAGNLTINASESVEVRGQATDTTAVSSFIASSVLTLTPDLRQLLGLDPIPTGKSGAVTINTPSLLVADRAQITAINEGSGNAGKLNINANSVILERQGNISATTISGKGGIISLQINTLEARNGGRILTTTTGSGPAGSIEINAIDSISLLGQGSGLFANTTTGSTGAGGSIVIDPHLILVRDQARIAVDSQGTGPGGSIELQAGNLILENGAFISAETASGQGGNIGLTIADILRLQGGSNITATAGQNGGSGNGGNINISAPYIIANSNENNDISANAFSGTGGNITLNTEGVFGFRVGNELTPFSDINASSQLGLAGSVVLNTPNINPTQDLVELPTNVLEASSLNAQTCPSEVNADSSLSGFVVTDRRGGVSPNPNKTLGQNSVSAPWIVNENSVEPVTPSTQAKLRARTVTRNEPPEQIIEAQGWQRRSDGKLVLAAYLPEAPTQHSRALQQNCQKS